MNSEQALAFLALHQPLPDDANLTQEQVDNFDKVREFFINTPNKEAIPLFLRAYGKGDGWGMYPLVEDVFHAANARDVIQEIKNTLENQNIAIATRYWVTQVAAAFPDPSLIHGLTLSANATDEDISEAAQLALDIIKHCHPIQ